MTDTGQSILQVFNSVWKEMSNLQKQKLQKNVSLCVYVIGITCFDKRFLFHVIPGRHYFFYKFIITQSYFGTTMLLYSLKKLFWLKSVFYLCCLLNNTAMLLISKVQNKASLTFSEHFFIDIVFLHSSILWVFHIFL